MKDYSKILESSRKASLQKVLNLSSTQNFTEWNMLHLMEEIAGQMQARLGGIMEEQWAQEITGVSLDLETVPDRAFRLMLKAQIYRVRSNELLLKVFAHEVLPKGQTQRIAKATYQIKIVRNYNNGGMVA